MVPFNPSTDRLLAMDFTASNPALTTGLLNNTDAFTRWVEQQLVSYDALYGIGGYAEHRTIYRRSVLFDPVTEGEEPRRLHLGTDIWGKPHTAVYAPMDGIVHSFGFHDQPGDYGATIILTHRLEDIYFYSLYGHLSLNSIRNLKEGTRVVKGNVIAEFGLPFENGHWPPHLHFQLITDLGGRKGDYPGVCRYSERQDWLERSPDPDLILQLNKYILNR